MSPLSNRQLAVDGQTGNYPPILPWAAVKLLIHWVTESSAVLPDVTGSWRSPFTRQKSLSFVRPDRHPLHTSEKPVSGPASHLQGERTLRQIVGERLVKMDFSARRADGILPTQ